MFALRKGHESSARGERGALFGMSFAVDGFVLPRWLRRPARILSRLTTGEVEPPRFAATIGTAAFLAVTGLYGAWLGGHVPTIVQGMTARTGFAIDEIRVNGQRETSEIDIVDRLELDGWTSLVGFDAEKARQRVVGLPWVQSAAIRKIYPDTLEVHLVERKPFAIWQHGSELSIVEASGAVIAPFSGSRHITLPLVIGLGAPQHAEIFIAKIRSYPELASRVKGYIRVAERRWDLRLENGITVKLPETGEDRAIADLLAMDREQGLLSRDIASVDMRLSDRLVVQLTPEAAVRRDAALKDRLKTKKSKPEKRI